MAFDAIAVRCLTNELKDILIGAKVDKVYQPERDELTLLFRTREGAYRLLLSASASHPRAHLTVAAKSNPATAPMFCMLLRKHLSGGKVADIVQPGFERVIDFYIESYTEFGDLTIKHLIVEIMGRHSNIILTDPNGRILDSIKHIDITVSSLRQVMPGLSYQLPPGQNKISPLEITEQEADRLLDGVSEGSRADKALMEKIAGFSPVVARELVYRVCKRTDTYCGELSQVQKAALTKEVLSLVDQIRENQYKPCMITELATGKNIDFAAVDITQYEGGAEIQYREQINELLDDFYRARDAMERRKQRSASLVKAVGNHIDRCVKKLVILKTTIDEAADKEKLKTYADLIIANIYRIHQGQKFADLENFYQDGELIHVPLDENLSPQANAQKYYKAAHKAKNALQEAANQLDITQIELDYLENVMESINLAVSVEDLNEIRDELAKGGYIQNQNRGKRKEQKQTPPLHFVSSDGFDIYCGKNNTQNDYLTLRFANNSDIWFHTKNIPGSHTVIKLGLDKEVPDTTIMEAATLAALHSSAKDSAQVPVDYTQIKNVKKPNSAKPGMVIYDHYNTVYVTPDAGLAKKLKVGQ